MILSRAALRADEIIVIVDFEDVWPFDPYRFLIYIGAAVDKNFLVVFDAKPLRIEAAHPDRALSLVERLPFRGHAVVDKVRFAVSVEEERRIDTADLGEPDRLRPGPGRVLRRADEISSRINKSTCHIECTIMVSYRRSKYSARDSEAIVVELVGPVDDISD